MLVNCPHMEHAGIHNHPGVNGTSMKSYTFISELHFLFGNAHIPHSIWLLEGAYFYVVISTCLQYAFTNLDLCSGGFFIRMGHSDSHGSTFARNLWFTKSEKGFRLLNLSIFASSSSLLKGVSAPKKKKQPIFEKEAKPSAKPLANQQKKPHTESQKPPLLGSSLAKLGATVPHDTCQRLKPPNPTQPTTCDDLRPGAMILNNGFWCQDEMTPQKPCQTLLLYDLPFGKTTTACGKMDHRFIIHIGEREISSHLKCTETNAKVPNEQGHQVWKDAIHIDPKKVKRTHLLN